MNKVIYKKEDSIAWFILNRPYKRNAIDDDVMNELELRLSEVKNDSEVKCLVITGTGEKAFCSGGDLSVFHQLKTASDAQNMLMKMGSILYDLFTLPKPTIAILNGTAVCGGCEIATACDFRVAYPHASIGFIQGTLGITTGWGGASFLFERLPQQAALSLLTSAQKLTVEQAHKLGFIHKIISNRQSSSMEVIHIIQELFPLSNQVLSTYKRRYLDSINLVELRSRIEKEIHECSILWEMDEHAEAVQRFLNK